MCGRFTLDNLTWGAVRELMGADSGGDLDEDIAAITDRYNVAPSQPVPLVRFAEGEQIPGWARWGLIPHWFRKPLKEWKATTINARVETVATAPTYRDAYRNGRCIIPMSGYYEWSTLTGQKEAFYVHPSGNEAGFLTLGLWTDVELPDWQGETVTMLTEPAEGMIAAIHDRQPIIVDADAATAWLKGGGVEDIPRQPPSKRAMHKVSPAVNTWKSQGPDLIRPVEDGPLL